MYDFTKKRKDRKIQAIRHTLTPSIGFAYTPDFGDPKYGYYQTRQTDSTGRFTPIRPIRSTHTASPVPDGRCR